MDVLSDVLRAVRLNGAVYFDIDAGCPWTGESPGTSEIAAAVMPGAEHVISFHAILSGSCWVALSDGSAPAYESARLARAKHPPVLGPGDRLTLAQGSSTMGPPNL